MSESMVERASEIVREKMAGNNCIQDVCRHAPCECADDIARAVIDLFQATTAPVETATRSPGHLGTQRKRSEAEQALPEWMRDALDRARNGINPQTNQPMSKRDAVAYVNAHLPPEDPGRLFDAEAHEIGRLRWHLRQHFAFARFVHFWTNRDNVTDAERVSVIKNHPSLREWVEGDETPSTDDGTTG